MRRIVSTCHRTTGEITPPHPKWELISTHLVQAAELTTCGPVYPELIAVWREPGAFLCSSDADGIVTRIRYATGMTEEYGDGDALVTHIADVFAERAQLRADLDTINKVESKRDPTSLGAMVLQLVGAGERRPQAISDVLDENGVHPANVRAAIGELLAKGDLVKLDSERLDLGRAHHASGFDCFAGHR